MNKRDIVLALLDDHSPLPYTPAAFFLHFPSEFHEGQAAVNKHLEYFRHTGMDFIKIQYERKFPPMPHIQKPEDWASMPSYGRDFFEGQLKAVEGLVKAAKSEALIIQTLYSPFMCAVHATSSALLTEHLSRDPEKVRKGMEIITESLRVFVRECVKLGVDGFYTSTQGGEAGRFTELTIFEKYIKPFDLSLMVEINQTCPFNILHVCDYQLDYATFAHVLDYPGHIVNCPLTVGGKHITPREAVQMFKRPFMGGLDRKGALNHGPRQQIQAAIQDVQREAPHRFILGADCTVLNDTPWDNLKMAIEIAHGLKAG